VSNTDIIEKIDDPIFYIEHYFRVLTKANEHGVSNLVPMELWPVQVDYIKNRTHRDIVLKPRQVGASTGIMAANAYHLFTEPYHRMIIITHDQETSEFLFQTIQRFHRNLPEEMRPKTDWRSGSRMRFPLMDSYIYIDSAKSDSLGIGHTLNIAHLSEVAKWPPKKAEDLFADISQTVPIGGFITLESTPKGRQGLFYRLYDAAKRGEINYKPFFYPWWWDVNYARPIKGRLIYTKEEQLLVERHNLKPEQIAFRREKIAELGDLFYQEYPENDVDCWLTSDISVFDGVAIRRYLLQIKDGRQEGNLTIWKDVIGGEKYVIGVDPAGGYEKGDFSVASVIRIKTNEYVARLRGKIAPDFFGQQLINLGKRYNNSLIGVERMQHGHTVLRILLEANYPNIYQHQDYDTFTQTTKADYGWKTSAKTKPVMVDTLAAALRSGDLISWSENLLTEASGYIWEGQKTRPSQGGYDDELDAVMIALQLREQLPITEAQKYKPISYASI